MTGVSGEPQDHPDTVVASTGFAAACRTWAPRLLVMVGLAPINFALVIPRPVLKSIETELGGNASNELLLKMIIAIIGLSVVIGAPLAGALIRKFGQRAGMVSALALFTIAGCLPYLLHDLYSIVVSRALLGLAVAAIQVSAVSLAGELYNDQDRAKILGFMTAVASCAALILGPLSGILGEISWRAPFLLHLAGLPFVLLAIAGLPRSDPARVSSVAARASTSPGFRLPYRLVGLGFIGGAIMTLPPAFLAFRLADIGITAPATVGLSFIAMSVPDIIAAAFYGYMRRYISLDRMMLIGFGFGVAGLCVVALSPAFAGIIVGMALLGPTTAFIYSSVMERASLSGEHRSQVVGVIISAVFLSLVVGTFAAEPIFQRFGASGVMIALALVSAVTMVALIGGGLRRIAATKPARLDPGA